MKFEALYYDERLSRINSHGDVGVCVLWSLVEKAKEILEGAGVDLNQETSRIAVIANLYGNGLPQMLRNLLWNPQIQHIVIVGKNLSGSREELINFFGEGLEEVDFLGTKAWRIKGTNKTIDNEVKLETFLRKIQFTIAGDDLGSPATTAGIVDFFCNLPPFEECTLERVPPPPIPEPKVIRFPSNPRSHMITRRTPTEAWLELVFRLVRFGYRNKITKSSGSEERVELQNVHVVVESPVRESDKVLQEFGFSLKKFEEYQCRILDPVKPLGTSYTYGNRLRGHFKDDKGVVIDALEICGQRLRKKPDSRNSYFTNWDNTLDLVMGESCPCFVTGFFRHFDGELTLTATFRAHNAMDGWLENIYGLIAILEYVAAVAGLKPGAISVISHSISVDPASLERAIKLADSREDDWDVDFEKDKKREMRHDPNGEFTFTVDREAKEIVAFHSSNGMKIGEYRGKNAEEVERQIARDLAASLPDHLMYIGRQLTLKELELKEK